VQQGKKISQVLGVKRSDQFGMVALCRYQVWTRPNQCIFKMHTYFLKAIFLPL
jgi:hypothetical protein